MTLQEFFGLIGENPSYVLLYFAMLPLTAFLAGIMGQGEGAQSPWKYLYSVLIYLVSVPGIFAFTLNVYLFLFERRSVLDSDIYIQILPIISMIATLLIIRKNVSYKDIPGFDKLSGLVMMILATFAFMWLLDRTHIYVFSYLPFWQAILIFVVIFLLIRVGWSRFMNSSDTPQYPRDYGTGQ